MALRFHPDGDKVLTDWLARDPSEADQRLVARVLSDIAADGTSRWYRVTDTSDHTVTIYEPREGLTVHVRLYTDDPDQFELVRILYMTTIDPADIHARDY